jgi:hypothetical protein
MSGILSASMTVRRREEAFLVRARMDAIDAKLNTLVMEVGASPSSPPAFTDADVEEVGKLLVEGRIRLPTHARLTVRTSVEDVRDERFNTSTEVFTHTADQLHTHRLRPLTVLEALEAGLLVRLGSNWFWCQSAYERLSNA